MIQSLVMFGCAVLLVTGCRGGREPKHATIEQAYFKCGTCRSLEGGNYGKGPFKRMHSQRASSCMHDWERISREDFKDLGTQWQSIDWEKEIPFWSRDGADRHPDVN